ncbi:MAG TPA: NfeD family protein [Actinomycetota bacterium]|nr:NfeD family protein [Actinomycetota bacterium]
MLAASQRALAVVGAAIVLAVAPSVLAQSDRPSVLLAEVSGVITPVIADHLREAVELGERDHDAVLVTLDTPGGLETSMREIVQSFLNARVPVIVWVTPAGAQAASAGAVIALAAHVAAMSPGTSIGAATPVALQGGEVGDKVINNAAAYVAAIAEERGRDREFARDIVTEGRSEPASRALRIGAVDLLVADRQSLLDQLDEREVSLIDGDKVVLRTDGANVVGYDLGFVKGVRQRLADPNLAFLFMSLGTLAIVYELSNPGIGFGGIVGVILVVLGFFALSVLPVNFVGIALLILAAALFIAELFVPGVGVLAGGGAVSLVLSGLFLVRGPVSVDLFVILPTAAVLMGAVIVAGRLVWKARRAHSATGAGQLEGRVAEVRHADGTRARVFLEGAWWTVKGESSLHEGERVRVKAIDGLELLVDREDEGG